MTVECPWCAAEATVEPAATGPLADVHVRGLLRQRLHGARDPDHADRAGGLTEIHARSGCRPVPPVRPGE